MLLSFQKLAGNTYLVDTLLIRVIVIAWTTDDRAHVFDHIQF